MKVGEKIVINGVERLIVAKERGAVTKKINYQSGIIPTGVARKPPVYILENGQRVTMKTIRKNGRRKVN